MVGQRGWLFRLIVFPSSRRASVPLVLFLVVPMVSSIGLSFLKLEPADAPALGRPGELPRAAARRRVPRRRCSTPCTTSSAICRSCTSAGCARARAQRAAGRAWLRASTSCLSSRAGSSSRWSGGGCSTRQWRRELGARRGRHPRSRLVGGPGLGDAVDHPRLGVEGPRLRHGDPAGGTPGDQPGLVRGRGARRRGWWRRLFSITLPLLSPSTFFVIVLSLHQRHSRSSTRCT